MTHAGRLALWQSSLLATFLSASPMAGAGAPPRQRAVARIARLVPTGGSSGGSPDARAAVASRRAWRKRRA